MNRGGASAPPDLAVRLGCSGPVRARNTPARAAALADYLLELPLLLDEPPEFEELDEPLDAEDAAGAGAEPPEEDFSPDEDFSEEPVELDEPPGGVEELLADRLSVR